MRSARSIHLFFSVYPRTFREPSNLFLASLSSLLSLSWINHVATGYAGVVVHTSKKSGRRFAPQTAYAAHYQGLRYIVKIPVDYAIDLNKLELNQPLRIGPSLKRWVSGGRSDLPEDCVGTALMCLIEAGVDVPPDLVSPVQLLRWSRSRYASLHVPARSSRAHAIFFCDDSLP